MNVVASPQPLLLREPSQASASIGDGHHHLSDLDCPITVLSSLHRETAPEVPLTQVIKIRILHQDLFLSYKLEEESPFQSDGTFGKT